MFYLKSIVGEAFSTAHCNILYWRPLKGIFRLNISALHFKGLIYLAYNYGSITSIILNLICFWHIPFIFMNKHQKLLSFQKIKVSGHPL